MVQWPAGEYNDAVPVVRTEMAEGDCISSSCGTNCQFNRVRAAIHSGFDRLYTRWTPWLQILIEKIQWNHLQSKVFEPCSFSKVRSVQPTGAKPR